MHYYELKSAWTESGDATGQRMLQFPSSANGRWLLKDGQPVTDWNSRLFAIIASEGVVVDFGCVFSEWHVMSDRMQSLITRLAPGAVQFLPFRIRSPIGDVAAESYAVANYLVLQRAIDKKLSKPAIEGWVLQDWGDYEIEHLVLNRKAIGDARIFRVYGQSDLVVVREDLVDALQAASITGCAFSSVEVAE